MLYVTLTFIDTPLRSSVMKLSAPVQKTEGNPKLLAEEIRGFIALFPFNVTAETWLLGLD